MSDETAFHQALADLTAQLAGKPLDAALAQWLNTAHGPASQKCTAIRRILVPFMLYAAVAEAVSAQLASVVVDNPRNPEVRMGSLVRRALFDGVQAGIDALAAHTDVLHDGRTRPLVDADPAVAACVGPVLLGARDADRATIVHDVEVFGPVATLLPYNDLPHALALAQRGQSSLVTSLYDADDKALAQAQAAIALAASNGRVHVVTPAVATAHTSHGNVMPMSLHGGPGRAGGGAELGGLRALDFYHQRSAVQAGPEVLAALGCCPPNLPAKTTPSRRRHAINSLPEQFNFAQHLFALNRARGDRIAYIDDQGALSYSALEDRARRLATVLANAGVLREERVLLLMLDTSDWPVAFLGCLYAGVVPVAVNTLLKPDDYAYMLTHCRAQAALVSGALLPVLNEALALAPHHDVRACVVSQPKGMLAAGAVDMQAAIANTPALAAPARTGPDEPGFWLYSSGSTGKPKGTVHTQGSLWWTTELYGKAVLGLTDKDVCFSAAKLYFAYGLGNSLIFPLSVGATVVLMAERPTPDATFERWTRHQPTVFFGAPTGFAGMLASPRLPSRNAVALRMCSSAGEALPAEIAQRFKDHFGCDIIDGIGSTEMLHIFLSNRPGDVRYGSTGKPVLGYEISLRGEDGSEVPQGEIGDLYIQGPSAALMYWNNRAKTRETFQGAWTKSGDKYVRDAEGYYTYAGRSDDMLKVSGIYVSPFEVEATLMQHASVLEAAVIGTQDADGLTKTKAFVVLKDGQAVTPDELKAFVKERLAPYRYPRLIEFLPELPKTATGKIQRFRLREREQRA